MQQWQVQSNIEAFGHYEAAKQCKKAKVPFSIAYGMIFNRAPRRMHSMTYDCAYGLIHRFLLSQNIQPSGIL